MAAECQLSNHVLACLREHLRGIKAPLSREELRAYLADEFEDHFNETWMDVLSRECNFDFVGLSTPEASVTVAAAHHLSELQTEHAAAIARHVHNPGRFPPKSANEMHSEYSCDVCHCKLLERQRKQHEQGKIHRANLKKAASVNADGHNAKANVAPTRPVTAAAAAVAPSPTLGPGEKPKVGRCHVCHCKVHEHLREQHEEGKTHRANLKAATSRNADKRNMTAHAATARSTTGTPPTAAPAAAGETYCSRHECAVPCEGHELHLQGTRHRERLRATAPAEAVSAKAVAPAPAKTLAVKAPPSYAPPPYAPTTIVNGRCTVCECDVAVGTEREHEQGIVHTMNAALVLVEAPPAGLEAAGPTGTAAPATATAVAAAAVAPSPTLAHGEKAKVGRCDVCNCSVVEHLREQHEQGKIHHANLKEQALKSCRGGFVEAVDEHVVKGWCNVCRCAVPAGGVVLHVRGGRHRDRLASVSERGMDDRGEVTSPLLMSGSEVPRSSNCECAVSMLPSMQNDAAPRHSEGVASSQLLDDVAAPPLGAADLNVVAATTIVDGWCTVCNHAVDAGGEGEHEGGLVHTMNVALGTVPAVPPQRSHNPLILDDSESGSGPAHVDIAPYIRSGRCSLCQCDVEAGEEQSHLQDVTHSLFVGLEEMKHARPLGADPVSVPFVQPPLALGEMF